MHITYFAEILIKPVDLSFRLKYTSKYSPENYLPGRVLAVIMKIAMPGRGVPIALPGPLTSAGVPNWGCSTAQFFRVGLRSRYPEIIKKCIGRAFINTSGNKTFQTNFCCIQLS